MKKVPLMRKIMFEALKMCEAIYSEKKACPYGLMVAFSLLGLTIKAKIRLKMILPAEKNTTAAPETLFRCPGN